MTATVRDGNGRLVQGLPRTAFEVYEDGKKQTARYFSAGLTAGPGDPQTHLGLLLDVSESMGDDISFTKTAAIKFLNTLVEAVDITVVDFDTEVRATRYSQVDFARVIERIRRFIVADEPFGIDNEQLTPSMKIRRHVIGKVYGERLDALYKR